MVLRPFSAKPLPIMLLKPIIPFGTSLKKSKKRQAIAPALGELWEVPGELWEGLGSPRTVLGSSGMGCNVQGMLKNNMFGVAISFTNGI